MRLRVNRLLARRYTLASKFPASSLMSEAPGALRPFTTAADQRASPGSVPPSSTPSW